MYFVLLVACILDQWLNASCDIAQIQKVHFSRFAASGTRTRSHMFYQCPCSALRSNFIFLNNFIVIFESSFYAS